MDSALILPISSHSALLSKKTKQKKKSGFHNLNLNGGCRRIVALEVSGERIINNKGREIGSLWCSEEKVFLSLF